MDEPEIVRRIGAGNFFGRIKAYYDVRGWETPGTKEQFEEAAVACWELEVAIAPDGTKWYRAPGDTEKPDDPGTD